MATERTVFDTDKRIRLGIWGLGRGLSFYRMCKTLNMDVVAGCDFNDHMRKRFKKENPEALVTANADEFLEADFDAVLLATFCPGHAEDAIACLEAGKHVLSEVTAFHTLAEGVRLVEAVERSGRVYNLAENYAFVAPHMYLAEKWKEGLFGQLMYAEGEYVHDVRSLCYTYIDGVPITPGYALHNWRSWLHFHYYCTHSLGPIMYITGERPTRVVALPGAHCLAGSPKPKVQGFGGIAPSLINMSNGAVVRNLMGGTTNDVHVFRYWGTKGAAENHGRALYLRLGADGGGPKLEVRADWAQFGNLATQMGHGGGDFWVLYFFARQILFGTPAPFDIYSAADVTMPGILAFRSIREGGRPFDIPDLRTKKDRDTCRNDHYAQERYDATKVCFPRRADKARIGAFDAIMKDLLRCAGIYRAYADWAQVIDTMVEPAKVVEMANALTKAYPDMLRVMKEARALADAYPRSEGARLLNETLEAAGERDVTRPGFLRELRKNRDRLRRKAKALARARNRRGSSNP